MKQVLFQVSVAPATTTVHITQRENSRSSMKTNHQWTRIGTRTDGPPSTTTGAKMLLHFCPVGVTLSWEEAHPGARASRPHKSSRSFSHLLHRNQPAAAPCLCLPGPCGSRRQGGRLQHRRETERQPKGQHAGGTPALPGVSSRPGPCGTPALPGVSINRRDSMRAGGGGYPAGDFSESRPVPFGKLPFACEPGARPPRLGRSIEKDYKLNIDAQDAQDNQDGRLLQETLTRAMIACGFEDVREHKPAVSGKNPVHPVHRCESQIYSCLTLNRAPAPPTTVRITQRENSRFNEDEPPMDTNRHED